MTLEAGKEMDKCCVLNWLNEVYVTPSRAFDEYTEDELKMFAHDALVLLKDQEAVKPTWSRGKPFCGACGLRIHGGKFCSECGKPILWEGRRSGDEL